MENFKEIAEKCLAGELSGTFVLKKHTPIHSKNLHNLINREQQIISGYYYLEGIILNDKGKDISGREQVQNFISDNMTQKKIEIDIPEGKVPVMEQTEKGVVITWKEKELTFEEIYNNLVDKDQQISTHRCSTNCNSNQFNKKVEVLRKLTNIRNYFGEDKPTNMWTLTRDSALRVFPMLCHYRETCHIYFDTREHAEQAIKMLGDELKYLFEPW